MSAAEWSIKQERVRAYLRKTGLEAFVFGRRASFAWLTDGGESSVHEGVEAGAADLVITRDGGFVVAPNNEMARLMDEVLAGQGYEPVVYSWSEDRGTAIARVLNGRPAGSDIPTLGCKELYGEIKRLRFSLLPGELERMRILGKRSTQITCEVAAQIRPGDTEAKIAGQIKARMNAEGIATPVVLIASDERIDRYRHPVPTDKRAERVVMLVVCAQRWGLTVALTRMVHFGSVPQRLRDGFQAASLVLARVDAATIPGRPVKEIFQVAVDAYAEAGFGGEWQNHHQGGSIGYETRDYIASPASAEVVVENQAFAWNPSVTGAKAEDTIIVTPVGQEVITVSDNWPAFHLELEGTKVLMPDILTL